MLGAVYLDRGLDGATVLVRRLFDPLMDGRQPAGRGARLEDRAAGADGRARAGRARSTSSPRAAPTTPSASTAEARRRRRACAASGAGRSKKEAEQQAAEAAWRALGEAEPAEAQPAEPCPSCPRSRSSGSASSAASPAAPSRAVEVAHPRAVRRHAAGAADFAALLDGPHASPAAPRRGKYLWLPLDSGDALTGHLGMSGQLLVVPPDKPDETHLRVRFRFADGGRELRFVDQRTFGGLPSSPGGDRRCRSTIAHIARDPLDPAFDDEAFVDGAAPAGAPASSGRCSTRRWSAASATSTPTRRCGGCRCTGRGRPRRCPGTTARALLGHVRDVLHESLAAGRHQLRRALRLDRGRQRAVRALAARLRPRGRAVRPLRHAAPPRRLHEPLVVQLPALPAAPRRARY